MSSETTISRAGMWTPELDKLLTQWKRSIANRKRGHLELSRMYTRRHYWFGVPTTMLGTLMSAGILTTFRNCSDCEPYNSPTIKNCAVDEYIRLSMGMIGVISTMLAAVQTFMDYSARAERHKTALDSYESLYGLISTLLLIPREIRGDPVDTLRDIRVQFDNIIRTHPVLPLAYDDSLAYTTEIKIPRAPRPIDVDNRKSSIVPLSAILNEESSGEYTHSDESDEVCTVEYDIEAGVLANQMANAPAALAANLAARNKDLVQRSLASGLAFEMTRLQNQDRDNINKSNSKS